jgi:hypothetical protein
MTPEERYWLEELKKIELPPEMEKTEEGVGLGRESNL